MAKSKSQIVMIVILGTFLVLAFFSWTKYSNFSKKASCGNFLEQERARMETENSSSYEFGRSLGLDTYDTGYNVEICYSRALNSCVSFVSQRTSWYPEKYKGPGDGSDATFSLKVTDLLTGSDAGSQYSISSDEFKEYYGARLQELDCLE